MAYFSSKAWIAAANPDIEDLDRLIADVRENPNASDEHDVSTVKGLRRLEEPAVTEYNDWVSTPLLRAIKHNNMEHVRALLEAGVDPNGIEIRDMLRFAVRILSGDDVMKEEIDDLNDLEMLERLRCFHEEAKAANHVDVLRQRHAGYASPFWGNLDWYLEQIQQKHDILPDYDVDMSYGNVPVSSLTVAAWCDQTQIIDLLLAHGADATSWTCSYDDTSPQREIQATCSSLSLITPLHAAIQVGCLGTIRHLLKRGFNPNATRSLGVYSATSALQYSMVARWERGASSFEVLAEHARADFSMVTPFLQVSCLHLAVATLDRRMVERVLSHSSSSDLCTSVTALGHTVLHIACLPAVDSDIKFHHSPTGAAAQSSIRHCRAMVPQNEDGSVMDLQTQHRLQSDMIIFLLGLHEQTTTLLVRQDIFGNTPLHYLAGAHQPNEELLAHLKDLGSEVSEAWGQSINDKGYSPKDLYGK